MHSNQMINEVYHFKRFIFSGMQLNSTPLASSQLNAHPLSYNYTYMEIGKGIAMPGRRSSTPDYRTAT